MMYYVQCNLEKGNRAMVTTIPEKFAVVGKVLELKEGGTWENGWVVKNTYNKISEEAAIAARDRHKYHRRATDV